MHRFSLLPFLIPSILTLTFSLSQAQYRQYSDCAPIPYTCGDVQFTLGYPFRSGVRPNYCGHPSFFLDCINKNSTLAISISNKLYSIRQVDNINKLLTIANPNFTGQSCPETYKNTTIDATLFEYVDDRDRNLTIYYNCTASSGIPLAFYVGCVLNIVRNSYYSFDNGSASSDVCQSTVVIPMSSSAAGRLESGNANLGAALTEGFVVRWLVEGGWCPACVGSGGLCGYNQSVVNGNTCFCADGTAVDSCPYLGSDDNESRGFKSSSTGIAVIIAPIIGVILLGLLPYYFWWRLKRRRHAIRRAELNEFRSQSNTADLPFMDLAMIQVATGNFSDENKLGEGGFGSVYKGKINSGQEIAVKRLSKKSKQGTVEFKNEVKLIAKLQHKNLARMLGYCVEKKEKLLIYEYLPNRSLDVILFDPSKRSQLDWSRRRHIVAGITRGLLYLHEDSLLKVIHRDLKAGNVLLDREMNPKISDFGMAKIFEADEAEVNNSTRIVGTYGYMAPETAMDGVFSVKSDVYSFGVLLLEILTGERNGSSHLQQHGQTLLRRAWQQWSEDNSMEMIDSVLRGVCPTNEVMRLIHIGLLCVQEDAEKRPTMSLVLFMLQSDQMVLQQPEQPPTFFRRRLPEVKTQPTNTRSINDVTYSSFEPR